MEGYLIPQAPGARTADRFARSGAPEVTWPRPAGRTFLFPGAVPGFMVLRAKDIMDSSVLMKDEEVDALTCARAMVAVRKGYAVTSRGTTPVPVGIVTEWDYLEKVTATGRDPSQIRLKEIASPTVHTCGPDTPTDEVVTTMATLGVRRILVRSGDQVLGVITAKNVLAIFRQYVDKVSSEIAAYQSGASPPV